MTDTRILHNPKVGDLYLSAGEGKIMNFLLEERGPGYFMCLVSFPEWGAVKNIDTAASYLMTCELVCSLDEGTHET